MSTVEPRGSMTLHELISQNRDALIATAVDKVRRRAPAASYEELSQGIPDLVDEIVLALRRNAGAIEPPPQLEAAGTKVGRARQMNRESISLIAFGIGAVFDAVGELAVVQNLTFSPREYQIVNQCIDASIAAAIEEYAKRERAQRRFEETKRVGFIAHEIRNALASAHIAYANLKKGLVGMNSRTGDILGRNLTALQGIVGQMLAAVQLEGGAPIDLRPVRVCRVLEYLQEAVLPERGVVVDWELDQQLVALADERLLSSAAHNLVQNAIKFTRDGGHVVVRARAGDNNRVLVEVQDECGGLPFGKEEELCLPFVQGSIDRRGLGLGLAITREAMVGQGGRMTVQNLPGHGCIFGLEIPSGEP